MNGLLSFVREKNRTTPTWLKVLIPFMALGGLAIFAASAFALAFIVTAWLGNPIPVFGFDQSPEQPIAFPHPVHAGVDVVRDADGNPRLDDHGQQMMGLGLDCTFCHRTVDQDAPAGVPAVQQCIVCHQVVGAADSPELQKLRAVGMFEETQAPINWQRVHRLPDHTRFVHEPHVRYLSENPDRIRNAPAPLEVGPDGTVNVAQTCSTCHGAVVTMEQVRQVEALKMGQCVDCHRANFAPTDCATCHY